MEKQKTKPQKPTISSSGGVGEDVSRSVVVTGNENVINLDSKNTTDLNSHKKKSQPKKTKTTRKPNAAIIGLVGVIILAICGLAEVIISPVWTKYINRTPTLTIILTMESPTLPNTEIPETPVTDSLAGTEEISSSDGMTIHFVPAGKFNMGSKKSGSDGDESPEHTVYLDSFWIDQTEVTNAMYKLCVDAGKCSLPSNTEFFINSSYAEHPVVYVTWFNADQYCIWAGRRLPTEAEWEKAARGTDGRTYPWGDEIDYNKANYDYYYHGTKKAGLLNFPSFYGALDMAGNVWEWVSDWYGKSYYQTSDLNNPKGPQVGEYHVIRGGSFESSKEDVSTTARSYIEVNSDYKTGFRCAGDDVTP